MRQFTRLSRPWLPWSLAAVGLLSLPAGLTACSSSGSGLTTQYVCSPACPAGAHCGESGCVADAPPQDLAGTAPDLVGAAACSPACGGTNPYCSPAGLCVPCLMDAQCPVGQVCKTVGGTSACVAGCADDGRCGGAGKKCCGGQCTDVTVDARNCGACGTGCQVAHATSSCQASACAPGACDPGWGDCNKNPADGCEASIASDVKNCGACGNTCKIANAIAGCAAGCYIAACLFGYDDCNAMVADGCETSVLSDIKNCGACGNACMRPPHASSACVNAACQLAACDPGFADCDGMPQNGCETNIFIDAKNCGACGNSCGQGLICKNGGCTCPQCNFPNASSKCVNNVCVLDKCVPGFADCNNNPKDGCEVDITSDPLNCNGCGMACPKNAPVCKDSMCTNAICNDIGYDKCPTGAKQWCDVKAIDAHSSDQALAACNTCYFGQGQQGTCQLSNGDCAGLGYSQVAQSGPTWGYQDGCSGAAGRVWLYGMSFTTYGRWAP